MKDSLDLFWIFTCAWQDGEFATPVDWNPGDKLILDPKARDPRGAPCSLQVKEMGSAELQRVPSGKEYLRWTDHPKLPWHKAQISGEIHLCLKSKTRRRLTSSCRCKTIES